MAVVAVAHQNTERAKALAQRIAACSRATAFPIKTCIINDLSLVPSLGTSKMPEVDILCLDASHPELVPQIIRGGGVRAHCAGRHT